MLLSLLAVLMTNSPSTIFVLAKPLRYDSSNNYNYEGNGNAIGRVRNGRLRNPSLLWNSFGVTDEDNSNDNDNDNYFVTNEAILREREDETAEFFMALNSVPTAGSMPSLSPTSSMVPSFHPSLSSLPSQDPSVSSFPSNSPSLSSIPSDKPSVSSFPSEEPSLSSIPSEEPSLSSIPSSIPTDSPTETDVPSNPPSTSLEPSNSPSFEPSSSPITLSPTTTFSPTTFFPSFFSTESPSPSPFASPSSSPSTSPFSSPSASPSTSRPSASANPSMSPTCQFFTPAEREESILAALDSVVAVDGQNLNRDITTPQGKATDWILNEDRFQLCPGDEKIIQRWVMAIFYHSTAGQDWNVTGAPITSTPFLGSDNECNWLGLNCTRLITDENEGCVKSIRFEKRELAGTIPTELGLLPELAVIEMEQGNTSGTIPTELGQLEKLVFIDMDFNLLTGSLPTELYQLTKLRTLDVNNNQLTGTISTDIGGMVDLDFVQLQSNLFEGTIPTEFGLLTKLKTFNVQINKFTGKMPDVVCDMSQLVSLRASCKRGRVCRKESDVVVKCGTKQNKRCCTCICEEDN